MKSLVPSAPAPTPTTSTASTISGARCTSDGGQDSESCYPFQGIEYDESLLHPTDNSGRMEQFIVVLLQRSRLIALYSKNEKVYNLKKECEE